MTQSLGTQVTIRLEPEMADRLREVARAHNCRTTLIREWVGERLLRETGNLTPAPPQIQVAGQGGWPSAQVTRR